MEFHVIETGSQGNAYVLRNKDEAILLECGANLNKIKSFFDFDFENLVGCLITHEHGDHAKHAVKLMQSAVNIYGSEGTLDALKIKNSHRSHTLRPKIQYKIGGFLIIPFDVKHDAAEPFGFVIYHKDCGQIVFLTDSFYSKYKFPGTNHFIIEANFSEKFISSSFDEEKKFLKNRILKSHMSIENCIDLIKSNQEESPRIENIVLTHLSDSNSNEVYFIKEMKKATGLQVFAANSGLKLDLKLKL